MEGDASQADAAGGGTHPRRPGPLSRIDRDRGAVTTAGRGRDRSFLGSSRKVAGLSRRSGRLVLRNRLGGPSFNRAASLVAESAERRTEDPLKRGLLVCAKVRSPRAGLSGSEELGRARHAGRDPLKGISLDARFELLGCAGKPQPVEYAPELTRGVRDQILVPDQVRLAGVPVAGALDDLGSPQPVVGALDDEIEAFCFGDSAQSWELPCDPRIREVRS